MKGLFHRFHSPIELAHHIWKLFLQPHHVAIDATCGGGYDTQVLSRLCSRVLSLDIQQEAIERATQLLSGQEHKRVDFFLMNHEEFPDIDEPIQLIVYNLGYLPGGDKSLTTMVSSTLNSVQKALQRIEPGGLVSITCYPGHLEGALEEKALLELTETLDPQKYCVTHHRWINRNRSPSLLLIQKSIC